MFVVANMREWLALLDELVKVIYFAIVCTMGGSARGTEFDHLQYKIHDNSQRNLYVLNGLVTIITEYVKTRSHHGHGQLIARTLPWQLGCLVLLIYGVIFPAASHIAAYALDRESAESYLSYVFVLRGRVMQSKDFTKVIHSLTSQLFDISMGLRQFRQTMAIILVNFSKIDFGDLDPEDEDLQEIHHMFGHSSSTAAKHYAIQYTDTTRELSHTMIASSQRVCLRYHAAIRLSHPNQNKAVVCFFSFCFSWSHISCRIPIHLYRSKCLIPRTLSPRLSLLYRM
jgi:hypothetical protein